MGTARLALRLAQRQQQRAALRLIFWSLARQRLQGHLVETHRLLVGCKCHGPGTGTPCIVDGLVHLYSLGGLQEVMGELPIVLLQPISEQGLQCQGYTPV